MAHLFTPPRQRFFDASAHNTYQEHIRLHSSNDGDSQAFIEFESHMSSLLMSYSFSVCVNRWSISCRTIMAQHFSTLARWARCISQSHLSVHVLPSAILLPAAVQAYGRYLLDAFLCETTV